MSALTAADRPLRVLHILRWVGPTGGGIRSYLLSLTAALRGRPVQLSAASVGPGSAPDYLPDVPHTGQAGLAEWRNAWRFWRWSRRGLAQVDVAHIHSLFGWPFVVGAAACVVHGVPFLVCPHAVLDPWYYSRKSWKKRLFLNCIAGPLLRRSQGLVATTAINAQAIRAAVSDVPIAVIVPGLEVNASLMPSGNAGSLQMLRVLYLGRLDQVKDVPTLIRAIGQLRREGIEAVLDIVGWGTDESVAEARQIIRELALDNAVHFRGYLDGEHKLAAMRGSHVMAIPSHCENFSFATAEALAVGLPVVTTTGIALYPLLQQYDCGQVVQAGDAAAMAKALAQYRDPQLRQRHAGNALHCARQELTLEKMGRELETLYRSAAARHI